MVAIGGALWLAASAAVIVPRQLGLMGHVYARDDYWSNGTYLWVGTRGAGWLVLSAILLLVGLAAVVVGIREHRNAQRAEGLPAARTIAER